MDIGEEKFSKCIHFKKYPSKIGSVYKLYGSCECVGPPLVFEIVDVQIMQELYFQE